MAKIKSFKHIGNHETNDLEVEHKNHQYYLANGSLTSNSHAASYGINTYHTAWLSTYYPLEFYAAVLTNAVAGEKQEYIDEIKRLGYTILPVDVNKSKADTTIENNAIRLALPLVKGVGDSVIPKIVEGQPYSDIFDFLWRSGATKTSIIPLSKVGALNSIDSNQRRVSDQLELFFANASKNKTKLGWINFIKDCEYLTDVEDFPIHDKMSFEYDLLGFSVAGSPFNILNRDRKLEQLKQLCGLDYDEFIMSGEFDTMFPVVLKEFTEKAQRKGGMMAKMKFGTVNGREFESPAFSGFWKHLKGKIKTGSVYIVSFTRDAKKDERGNLIDPYSIRVGSTGNFWYTPTQVNTMFIDIDGVDI